MKRKFDITTSLVILVNAVLAAVTVVIVVLIIPLALHFGELISQWLR